MTKVNEGKYQKKYFKLNAEEEDIHGRFNNYHFKENDKDKDYNIQNKEGKL